MHIRSPHNVVSIMTRLQDRRPRNRGFTTRWSKIFLWFPNSPAKNQPTNKLTNLINKQTNKPTEQPRNWKLRADNCASPRPTSLGPFLAIPAHETHRSAKTREHYNCSYANGFPFLAAGLHVSVLRSSATTGNTSFRETRGEAVWLEACQGFEPRVIRWRRLKAFATWGGGGRHIGWRPPLLNEGDGKMRAVYLP
jgi:hypothetical protein